MSVSNRFDTFAEEIEHAAKQDLTVVDGSGRTYRIVWFDHDTEQVKLSSDASGESFECKYRMINELTEFTDPYVRQQKFTQWG